MDWTALSAIGALAAAAFTAIAAGAAWRSVAVTRKTARAALLERLIAEYHSEDLRKALRLYGELVRREDDPIQYATKQIEAEMWSRPRRLIHWYFKKVWMLYESGSLSSAEMETLAGRLRGYILWRDVVLPVSRNTDPDPTDQGHFEWAEKMLAKFPPRAIHPPPRR